MPDGLGKEDVKQAFKEAAKEWLDEKYAEFGKWAFRGMLASLFAALVGFILNGLGWHK